MAANVRAGMTVDRAIWLAARPEFGVLEEELRRAGAKTVGGKPIKVALMDMTGRIKSDLLEKTFRLVIEGMESGGELAHLLEETADNARNSQGMRKEIKSSVTTYSIFIFFAAVLGAPALYAISLFFVQVMTKLWSPNAWRDFKGCFQHGWRPAGKGRRADYHCRPAVLVCRLGNNSDDLFRGADNRADTDREGEERDKVHPGLDFRCADHVLHSTDTNQSMFGGFFAFYA